MKTCPECNKKLTQTLTRQGIVIDICPQCEGIWLDRDEIYLFTRNSALLRLKFQQAVEKKFLSARESPVNHLPMYEIPMFDGDVHIDYCESTGGLWLDRGELDKFPVDQCRIDVDPGVFQKGSIPLADQQKLRRGQIPALLPLPNLAFSSLSVLFGMYAILCFVLVSASIFFGVAPSLALLIGLVIVALQFLLGPWLMDMTLRLLYRIDWVEPVELPKPLEGFISGVCQEKKIKFPKVGILADGAPQAFTYGHHPNNGRIVISKGLMELLQEKELQAVVAHEIGHMVHWDMLVMTAAQVVPLVLYYIYRTLIRMRSSGRDKTAGARVVIAVVAYIFYIISQYIVLWFSRIREYYADRFSGEITGEPNLLATALVKIGYGLAGRNHDSEFPGTKRAGMTTGIEALGIFDEKQAKTLAITAGKMSESMGEGIDKEALRDVARWDLWNPWGAYYELHSTHPLIAKRIQCLSNQSQAMGKDPFILFNDRKPESYWDDFFVDVFVYLLPVMIIVGWLLLASMGILPFMWEDPINHLPRHNLVPWGVLILLLGGASLFKLFYSYPQAEFLPLNIATLLKKIKVSSVNPVPCRVEGKIIGRGAPGLIFSEDFVMQDKTGIIFLDYQQPLGLWNFFFGLMRAKDYQQQDAEVVGWYRRAPVPYIEIKQLKVGSKVSKCYAYYAKLVFGITLCVMGIVLLFFI